MSDSRLNKAQEFFKAKPKADELPVETQDNSTKEQQTLFQGNLDKLDDWIKYEEFRLEKRDKESERDLRRKNAHRSFWFSLGWASFIGIFITIKGFHKSFSFSETEYLATIGTLSVTILTYYLVVVKSLFPNSKGDDKS